MLRNRTRLSFMFIMLFSSMTSMAQQNEILLWPNGAPGSEAKTENEKVRVKNGERILSNIHRPSITAFVPEKTRRQEQQLL